VAWLSFSSGPEDIGAELRRLNNNLEALMATFAEAVQAWKDAYNGQKARADAAEAALGSAQQAAQDAATALQQFQDDDAATDAQQIADATQALADQLQAALDEVQNATPEPPADDEPVEPPVDGEG